MSFTAVTPGNRDWFFWSFRSADTFGSV